MSRNKRIAQGISRLLSKNGWINPGFLIIVAIPPKYNRITWFGNMDTIEKRKVMLKAALEDMEKQQLEEDLKMSPPKVSEQLEDRPAPRPQSRRQRRETKREVKKMVKKNPPPKPKTKDDENDSDNSG